MVADLILKLGLEEGRNADALVAAESLAAWVHYVKEAARAIDPADRLTVELVALKDGSLKFPQILRKLDQTIGDISAGADAYPNLKTLAIATAAAVGVTVVQVGVERAMEPTVQTVELSETDRELLQGMKEKVEASSAAQHASRRFLESVERDPAVTEVTVGDEDHEELLVVPRASLPGRSSLWQVDEPPPLERTLTDIWDVVLIKASFVNRPARWTFLRDGLPFSAKMDDKVFLAAISDGRVPIALQEGVLMRLEVEFKERQEGQVWRAIDSTRRVLRVVQPQPLRAPLAMANRPKK